MMLISLLHPNTAPGATFNDVSMPVNAEEVAEGQLPAGRTEFVILGESAGHLHQEDHMRGMYSIQNTL